MQQRLQTADQRQLWHGAGRALARLGRPTGDKDADRGDPGVNEHVEYRPPDPGEIDDELRMARQLRQEPTDMGDDAGIRRPQGDTLEVPDLKDRRRRRHH